LVQSRSFVAVGGSVPEPVPDYGIVSTEGEALELGAREGQGGEGAGIGRIGFIALEGIGVPGGALGDIGGGIEVIGAGLRSSRES